MSDITHEEAHTGPIRSPKQLFWASLAAFVLPVFIIIGLVMYVTSANQKAPGASDIERGIAERLQKVGSVEIRDASRPLASGEEVYKAQCAACHATGVLHSQYTQLFTVVKPGRARIGSGRNGLPPDPAARCGPGRSGSAGALPGLHRAS